ncbi:hypothetical protein ACFU7Y_33535 [Kitasatospora sp. NPDC057542]|uniref:hypothetical protein n=1 Tax=Streptomycetaceae TaxID=2062 RepID=UPI001CCB2E64|nr:hypothetical protein [Streptomyces sp. LS1784]
MRAGGILAAVALLPPAVAAVGRLESRRGGLATAVGGVGLLFAAGGCALQLLDLGVPVRRETRTSAPGRADHVLTVVNRGESEQEGNTFHIGLETGTGLSARRWTVFTVRQGFPGQGEFVPAQWPDADHIRITTDAGYRVFTIDPGIGEPTLTESVGVVRSA